jgi:hypothetical protein
MSYEVCLLRAKKLPHPLQPPVQLPVAVFKVAVHAVEQDSRQERPHQPMAQRLFPPERAQVAAVILYWMNCHDVVRFQAAREAARSEKASKRGVTKA